LHDDLSPGAGEVWNILDLFFVGAGDTGAVLSRIAQAAPEVTMAPSTFRSSAIFAPTLSCSSNILGEVMRGGVDGLEHFGEHERAGKKGHGDVGVDNAADAEFGEEVAGDGWGRAGRPAVAA